MKIAFASQSYRSESLPLSAQRCTNLYPELLPPGAKVPLALFGTPGLKLHATLGIGPIRGMIRMDCHCAPGAGNLFVVSGPSLFRLSSNGDVLNMGAITGTGFVQMATNGTQIAILAGTEETDLYIATVSTLTQVTDADYPGATSVAFLDGYFLFTETNSGRFFISGSYDGTAFDALEFATAEGDPDNLVGIIVDHREAWLFGAGTIEVWYNSGAADFPFERASGAFIERGTIALRSISKLDNSVFWVGDDRVVYRADGYTPRRISTHAIENVLTEYLGLGDLIAFSYTQNGHAFYVLKKPDEFTFVYDVATGLWHERESHARPDYRVSTIEEAFNRLLVGDDKTGNVYALDPHFYTENGETFVSRAAAPPLWAEGETATANTLIIGFEPGVGLTTGQGSEPTAMLRWSDDGGRTWSNEHWRNIGPKGKYKQRAKWDRMGQFRTRVYEVAISDPVKRVIDAIAIADIEGGRL
jgi:hypothetical protein